MGRMLRIGVLVLIVILVAAPAGLAAETILLRNGQRVQGRILSQDRNQIVVQTAQGPRVIRKTEIQRIVFDRVEEKPDAAAQAEEERKKKEEERREAERRAAEAALAEEIARAQAEREQFERRQAEYQAAEAAANQPVIASETNTPITRTEESSAARSSWAPFWRAAVLPGWGHYYAGDNLFAGVYAGAFLFAGYNAYARTRVANDAKLQYESFSDQGLLLAFAPGNGAATVPYISFETARYRDAYSRNANRQQGAITLLGSVYLVQLVHAFFVDGGPWDLLMGRSPSRAPGLPAPEEPRRPASWGPLWRAALAPGWGHYEAGKPVFAAAYAGAFLIAGYNVYATSQAASDSRARYQTASDQIFLLSLATGANPSTAPDLTLETAELRQTQERDVGRQNTAVNLLAAVYLVQLTHAFFMDGGPWELIAGSGSSQEDTSDQVHVQLELRPATLSGARQVDTQEGVSSLQSLSGNAGGLAPANPWISVEERADLRLSLNF